MSSRLKAKAVAMGMGNGQGDNNTCVVDFLAQDVARKEVVVPGLVRIHEVGG